MCFTSNYAIGLINIDGTGLVKLVPHPIYAQSDFTISLDGSKVAFDDSDLKENHVAVVNSDSTGYVRIYDTLSYASYPTLSSNGSKLMFTSVGSGKSTLYITETKKSSVPVEIAETTPYWGSMLSADGSKLFFSNYTNGRNMQAYTASLDAKSIVSLIDTSYLKPDLECKTPSGDPQDIAISYEDLKSQTLPPSPLYFPLLVFFVIIPVLAIGLAVLIFQIKRK
jgi:Tol biopolymer transport system component